MSEEAKPPLVNDNPAVPVNPGPAGETGVVELQSQRDGANRDDAPQNDAAEMTSHATPVEQNTPHSIADRQSEPIAPILGSGQEEVEREQHPPLGGAASFPPDPVDEFSAPEYSLTEKLLDAMALISHDEFLAMGDYGACWDPDHELYEPAPSFDLVKKEDSISASFVEWRGHCPNFSTHDGGATYNGYRYTVPQLPAPIYNAMHLPANVTSDFSAHQVFEGIRRVLRGCPALSDQQCELLSFWCMATWFADQMDFIPRMTITGPRYAADLLLALLSRVCRRAILLAGIKPATLQQIPMKKLTPTLLIRQIKPGKSANELLDASDRRRYFVACGKQLMEFYCAKCVYVGEEYDAKQADNGLYIHLWRNAVSPKGGISISGSDAAFAEPAVYLPQLLPGPHVHS